MRTARICAVRNRSRLALKAIESLSLNSNEQQASLRRRSGRNQQIESFGQTLKTLGKSNRAHVRLILNQISLLAKTSHLRRRLQPLERQQYEQQTVLCLLFCIPPAFHRLSAGLTLVLHWLSTGSPGAALERLRIGQDSA